MNAKSVTWMYAFLPIVGLLIGSIISGGIFIISSYSDISSLLLAILIVIMFIILTGGLHLDGWIDMSDAFFPMVKKKNDWKFWMIRVQVLSVSSVFFAYCC